MTLRARPKKGTMPEGEGFGKPRIFGERTFLVSSAFTGNLITQRGLDPVPLVGCDLDGRWNKTPDEEVLQLLVSAEVAREWGEALIAAATAAERERL